MEVLKTWMYCAISRQQLALLLSHIIVVLVVISQNTTKFWKTQHFSLHKGWDSVSSMWLERTRVSHSSEKSQEAFYLVPKVVGNKEEKATAKPKKLSEMASNLHVHFVLMCAVTILSKVW